MLEEAGALGPRGAQFLSQGANQTIGNFAARGTAGEFADFANRYAEPLNDAIAARMKQIGVPDNLIGIPETSAGGARVVFNLDRFKGGGNVPGLGINVDIGVLNDDLLETDTGGIMSPTWQTASLADRVDAVIAHEYEESLAQGSHEVALEKAPNTTLKISDTARRILQEMADFAKPRPTP